MYPVFIRELTKITLLGSSVWVIIMMSRDEALRILRKYLHDDKMIKHCLAVEAIMRALARRLNEDEELWGLVGLLHDLDYEITNKDLRTHGLKTIEILRGLLPDEALDAIASHNENNGYKPSKANTKLIHALRAADHLSGLIIATALVMPNKKLSEVKVKSLRKKFKSKDFARSVRRDKILEIEKVGLSLNEFLELGLNALKSIASELGL